MNILVVDDEPAIVATLLPVLAAHGYATRSAVNARDALAMVQMSVVDLVLLDLGLPDSDGCDIIARLKELSGATIIVLSARHLEGDKVRALDEGADDYVNKPFSVEELLARIRAAHRRRGLAAHHQIHRLVSDRITIDFRQREVTLMGQRVHLSPKEFGLMEALCRQSGQVVTQRKLMIAGWNDPNVDGQYLRSYVALLRQKLECDPSDPELILTEPGVGYRLAQVLAPEAANE